MSSRTGHHHHLALAVPFDHNDPIETPLRQPLLHHANDASTNDQESDVSLDFLNRIRFHSFLYGIFVGFFVECGALVAHVLYQTYAWKDRDPSTKEIVIYSFAWATITSILPCLALLFLRSILLASNGMTPTNTTTHLTVRQGSEQTTVTRDSKLDLLLWN